jgi:hypothetical protein
MANSDPTKTRNFRRWAVKAVKVVIQQPQYYYPYQHQSPLTNGARVQECGWKTTAFTACTAWRGNPLRPA